MNLLNRLIQHSNLVMPNKYITTNISDSILEYCGLLFYMYQFGFKYLVNTVFLKSE